MSHIKLTILAIVALLSVAIAWVTIEFHDNSVRFESSDRQWSDQQTLNRNFDAVARRFARYRLVCKAPQAKLIRITSKDVTDIFAWPNYLLEAKWHVEFVDVSGLPVLKGSIDCQEASGMDAGPTEAMVELEYRRVLKEVGRNKWRRLFNQ